MPNDEDFFFYGNGRVGENPQDFIKKFENKVVSLTLSSEKDRQSWFVFSLEATGELRKRVVIPNVIPATVNVDIPDLEDFLDFCRRCMVGAVGRS